MPASSRPSRRHRVTAAFAVLLASVIVLAAPAAVTVARVTPTASTQAASDHAPVLLARAGSGTHSFGGGRSTFGSRRGVYGSRGYGYGRARNHSFLRGVFVGWTLGHFFGFGGGIPPFPLLFFALILYLMFRGGGRPP